MVALAVSQSLASLEWLNSGHFSPATLFATSEPGVWYDPSDVANTNWLYNLLTFTEQFDNAIWTKTASSVTANSTVAPDGTTTADTIVALATLGQHRVDQVTTIAAGTHTFSCYIKSAGYDFAWLRIGTLPSVVVSLIDGSLFNITDGTATATNVGNGWWRVTLSGACLANSTVRINVSSDNSGSLFTGNGTSGIFVWGAQLELGSTATTYQPITTVAAGTIARFPQATLYQDSAGTTPVTAPSQPVGLMLDKSQGLVFGPELVTNGNFNTNISGWTVGTGLTAVWENGQAKITRTGAISAESAFEQSFNTVAGKNYFVKFTFSSSPPGPAFGVFNGSTPIVGPIGSVVGERNYYFTATGSTTQLNFWCNTGETVFLDNVSVREVPGNHATQSTAGSRPTYGIVPATGRRNLLTGVTTNPVNTNDLTRFGDAASTLTVVSDTAAIAAAGLTASATSGTVYRLNNTAGTTPAYVRFNTSITMGSSTWTLSAFVRGSGTTGLDVNAGTWSGPTSQTLTSNYQIATSTGSSNTSVNQWRVKANAGTDLYFIMMQAEISPAATAYQSAVTAFEVTEANVASLSYLSFDGIDDFMITPTITPGVDEVQVFAGVRKLSDAATAMLVELSPNVNTNNGSFWLGAPINAGTANYQFNSKGTAASAASYTNAAVAAPVTNVLTALGDIAGDGSFLRVNGIQVTDGSSDQGTGNYLAYPLYIGRRNGASIPYNGQMYGLITRFGANLNTSQLVSTEGWMNTKTRAY